MPQKSFRKFGTIRSNNLSDIDNLTLSLNNLLDKLVDGSSTYISEDLDCIRSVSTTGLDNEGFLRFANNEEFILSPIDLKEKSFSPTKTYQNRLDIIRLFTGEPRISGGNGLSAKYYDADQIILNRLNGDFGEQAAFNGDPIPNSTETGELQNTTWTNGDFDYNGKISNNMTQFGGGVEWEGYFIPITTGVHEFRVLTSGLYHMDWQADDYVEDQFGNKTSSGNTYVTAKRIGLENKVQVKVVSLTEVQLVNISDRKFIGLSINVTGSNIATNENNPSYPIDLFDYDTGKITFAKNAVTGSVDDQFEMTVKKQIGNQDANADGSSSSYFSYKTPVLEKYRKYRVRFRFIVPEKNADGLTEIPGVQQMPKQIEFEFTSPITTMSNLRYTRIYTRDYDFSNAAKGRMINFIDDSVLFGGGEIGQSQSAFDQAGDRYVEVKTNKKVDIKYIPKTKLGGGSTPDTFNEIIRKIITFDTIANTNLIILGDTTGIEIGNKVFGTSVPSDTEVTEIVINQAIFLSKNFSSTVAGDPIMFINHRGFVKKVTGTTSGTTLTITGSGEDTSDLRTGMIVIGNDGTNGDFPNYTGITTSGSVNTVNISSSKTTNSTFLFFYQGKGLINDSMLSFCKPSETRCLVLTKSASLGDTQLFVEPGDSFDAVTTSWDAQGSAFKGNSSNITGTITDNSKADGDPEKFSITIDEGLVKPIASGGNFTVTSTSPSTGLRILCCPPTDTSPPFEAVETGLQTVPADPKLVLSQGNLVFDNLSATIHPDKIGTANASSSVNKSIRIETGVTAGADPTDTNNQGTTFKILCA